jgi:uncharacterized damage-inducible protein DinB
MDPAIAPFAELLGVDDRLLGKALDAVKPEDLAKRPGPHSNPLVWLIGHVVVSRNLLARTAGAPVLELAWANRFARKSQFDEAAGHPPLEELRRTLGELSARLQARLPQLTDGELSAPAPARLPALTPDVRGAIAFLVYHEAYHVGQVGYVMKWLGYPGIVDG